MAKLSKLPSRRGEALVAILNNPADMRILKERLWYRVPVESAPRRWPPQWLGFYQTKVFRNEAFSVRYFGKVRAIRRIRRQELFPDELPNIKSEREYYQVFLESLERRDPPIISYRLRRIVFISTTLHKLMTATEINDLFDDSPLEDTLWTEMKRHSIQAERQYDISVNGRWYFLDFALFCAQGKIDVETDGDRWHAVTERIPEDNQRNNALAAQGWQVLRFNGQQIRETMAEYCVPQITETINRLGGLQEAEGAPRVYYPTEDGIVQQLTLFDKSSAYTTESDASTEQMDK